MAYHYEKDFEKSYLKNFVLRKHMFIHSLFCSYNLEYGESLECSSDNIHNFLWIILEFCSGYTLSIL